MASSSPPYDPPPQKVHTPGDDVTSQKQPDAPSAPNESAFFQNHPMGMLLIDDRSHIVQANRQALNLLGYALHELTQMSESDLLHPEDINAQPVISIEDLDEVRAMTLKRHYRCKEGRFLPVKVHLSVFSRDLMMAVFEDISRQRNTEEALRKANEALDIVFQSANAAIFGLDGQSRVTFWNPAAEKLFGWNHAHANKPCEALPPETLSAVMQGRSFNYLEFKGRRIDNTSFHAVASAGPLRNENKEVVGLISIMFDITQRKLAEEALRQSEQLYRSLVENTQDGYFIGEWPSGRFRFLNQRMCKMLGYTQDEGLELTLWDIVEAGDQEVLKAFIDLRPPSEITAAPAVFRARCKDGTYFRAEISSAAITFEDRTAVQGLLRDVTETARLQAQLQQAQRLESIGTLAGGVAHDFNNLLMAILGNTTLAKLGLDPQHAVYERLNNIVTYVQDASSLTKQLLEFARGGKYEVRATALNTLVDKTVQMFGRAKKELSIHTRFEKELWTVGVDRGQVEQVLLNLLVNAWQAMPNGGIIDIETANVVISESVSKSLGLKPGKYVCISVADSGVGMDKQVQSKIFEPFFTTKDRGRGTGLGLASAYGIIKNHEGIINVYSEKGKGAKFTIYLPAIEALIDSPLHVPAPKTLPGTETILLIDDEQMILEIGQAILIELGYNPIVASCGKTALDIYADKKDKIDLVILDMIMPGMSGGETYDRIKALNGDIKVLLSSGYSINGEAARILNRGCNGFIQKPFNIEDLSRKIREVLDAGSCSTADSSALLPPNVQRFV